MTGRMGRVAGKQALIDGFLAEHPTQTGAERLERTALRLPVKVTLALAIIGELVAGYVVRDNLTFNVIMLVYPVEAIAEWQAAGGVA